MQQRRSLWLSDTVTNRSRPLSPGNSARRSEMTTEDKQAAMARVKSTVSFADMVDEHVVGVDGNDGDEGHQDQDEEEMLLNDTSRTRVFSVSKDRPITRIPTRVEMKTLTHKAKRPAVDIEFHDLTYAVNTTAGEYSSSAYYFICSLSLSVSSSQRLAQYIIVIFS